VPPLVEQHRIAAVLDKADAIRRKRRESLRLLDEFLRSAFLEMFGDPVKRSGIRSLPSGWQLVTVEEIAKDGDACVGGPFGSSLTRVDYVPAPGVPVIRGSNLVAERGAFRDEDFVFVAEAKAEALRRNLAFPGDIVFTQRGTLGQVARIPMSARYPRYVLSQSQMKVTVNEDLIDPVYVVRYFLSPRALMDLESRTLATGVPHINLAILKAFPLVLPPLGAQRRFAALEARDQEVRAHVEAATRLTERLLESLAQRAFRGEL
jgi:type I restriction enzyme S subunit